MTPCGKEALILAFEAVRQKWRERDDSRCVVGVVHLARDQLRKRFRYIGEHVTCIWINRQCVQLTMDWFFVCQHKRRSIEDQQKTLNQSSWFHWFYDRLLADGFKNWNCLVKDKSKWKRKVKRKRKTHRGSLEGAFTISFLSLEAFFWGISFEGKHFFWGISFESKHTFSHFQMVLPTKP